MVQQQHRSQNWPIESLRFEFCVLCNSSAVIVNVGDVNLFYWFFIKYFSNDIIWWISDILFYVPFSLRLSIINDSTSTMSCDNDEPNIWICSILAEIKPVQIAKTLNGNDVARSNLKAASGSICTTALCLPCIVHVLMIISLAMQINCVSLTIPKSRRILCFEVQF